MLISVVIPAFGRAETLDLAVRSALDQTSPCREVIVVDDASPVPVALSGGDPRVKVLRHAENRGPSASRATGVAAASGDWIAFLDSDDRWLPNKLAVQSAFHAALPDPRGVVTTTGWIAEHPGGERPLVPRDAVSVGDFAGGCWFAPGTTALMHRSVFDLAGPFDPALRRLEDYEWFLRFGLAGGRMTAVPDVLARIGWHRTTRADVVGESCRAVAARHLHGRDAIGDAAVRASVAAYLELVQASAFWYSRQRTKALRHLALSYVNLPRFGFHARRRFLR